MRRRSRLVTDFQVYAQFQTRNSIAHVATRIGESLARHLHDRVSMSCRSGRMVPHLPTRNQGRSTTSPVGVFVGFPREAIPLLTAHDKLVGVYVCEAHRIPKHWVEICNTHAAIIVPSTYCREAFVRSGVKVPVHVVPHGVDDPGDARVDPLPGIPLLHVFNANPMYARKGVDELLDAFARIRGDHPGLNLILKTNESPWTDKWRQPGVQVVTAHYSRSDLSKLYRKVAAHVFPSRGEGFGMTPLESLTNGTPVVVPNHTGMADFLDPARDCIMPGPYHPKKVETYDNPNGHLLDITPDQIVAGVEAFLADRDRYAEKARSFDWRAWSWDAVLEPLPGILEDVLRGPSPRASKTFTLPPLPKHPHPRRATSLAPKAKKQTTVLRSSQRILRLWLGGDQKRAYDRDPTGLGVVVSELAGRIPVTSKQESVLLAPFNPEHVRFSQFKVPVVAFTTFESDRWPDRWVAELNHCMKVLVPQEWVARSLRSSGCKVPVEVVPQAFKRLKKVRRRARKDRPFTVGFLGVPVARKNLPMVAEALPDGARLLVRAAWVPNGAKVPKGDNIEYLGGAMDDDALRTRFWSQIDVLCLPSCGEGYSMVPREAIHMGIPVVVSDIPAHDDLTCLKVRKAADIGAWYEFLGGTCGTWAKPDRGHLRDILEGLAAGTKPPRQDQPDHTWESTVALATDACDYRFTTYVPPQDAGGGIDRFARHMQAAWGGLKYAVGEAQVEHFAGAIDWLLVQFEYGLFDQKRIRTLIELKERFGMRVAVIVHSANGNLPERHMNRLLDTLADRTFLLNPGQSQFVRGQYLEHPWPDPAPYNPDGDPGILGTHGFIHRQKGYRFLFDVARHTHRRVLIAGKVDLTHPANRATYEKQIMARKNDDDELHLRYIPDGELEPLMGRAGALLYPYEPWRNYQASGAVRSAISFGRPLLVSDHPQYFDTPADVFPRLALADPAAMAAAVDTVLRDPSGWYEKQAAHARSRSWGWFCDAVKADLER